MAGAGKKTFTAGEVLTASDVNTYLMEQSVMYFAGTAARASAIPTPSTGMTSYIGVTGTASIPQIETYTGSAWQTPYGMTQVANVNFTSATSISINNVFNSTYDNYKIFLNAKSASTTSAVSFRLRNAGVDTSTSAYAWSQSDLQFVATPTWIIGGNAGTTSGIIGAISTLDQHYETTLANPGVAKVKTFISQGIRTDGFFEQTGGYANYVTAYDGITFTLPTSSGVIRIYGYRNS
jgi:hypothetical protein